MKRYQEYALRWLGFTLAVSVGFGVVILSVDRTWGSVAFIRGILALGLVAVIGVGLFRYVDKLVQSYHSGG